MARDGRRRPGTRRSLAPRGGSERRHGCGRGHDSARRAAVQERRGDQALEASVPLARAVGNELGAAYALGYLASVSFELGEFDRAAGYAGDAAAARAEPGVEGHFSAPLGLLAEAQLAARDGRLA